MANEDEKVVLEIPRSKGNGEVIRAATSVFKGQLMFSVRVWYRHEDGGLAPGKNGINLPRSEWAEFKRAVDELEKALTLTNEPANA